MTVNRYLFQSPSPSQVQVGRLDPSVKQEDTKDSQELDSSEKKSQFDNHNNHNNHNNLNNFNDFNNLSSTQLLDVYA